MNTELLTNFVFLVKTLVQKNLGANVPALIFQTEYLKIMTEVLAMKEYHEKGHAKDAMNWVLFLARLRIEQSFYIRETYQEIKQKHDIAQWILDESEECGLEDVWLAMSPNGGDFMIQLRTV